MRLAQDPPDPILDGLRIVLPRLGATEWKIYRELSGIGYVTILQMKVQFELPAYLVHSIGTRVVKVVFRHPHTETLESVIAQVNLAVSDLSLQTTLDFDYRVDEYLYAQEKLASILRSHNPAPCMGLRQGWQCDVCKSEHGDIRFGSTTKNLLDRISLEEFREMRRAEDDTLRYMPSQEESEPL